MSAAANLSRAASNPAWLDLVRHKVEALRYGQVYIVVHDNQVTQIECVEKTRISLSRPDAAVGDPGG